MEEILASIRRIIAEDGEQAPAVPTSEAPPTATPPMSDDILELTEVVEEEHGMSPATTAATEPEAQSPAQPPVPSAEHAATNGLVSDAAVAASLAALSQLNQLAERREKRMSDIPLGEGPRSIEGLVREMLRPLLKEWLDSNLPDIVERIVHEEVERLVRASRGR